MGKQALLLSLAGACVLAMASAQMLGAPGQGDAHSPEVRQAGQFSVDHLNSNPTARANAVGASAGEIKFVDVKDVTTQVVAGTLYTMTISVQDSHGKTFDMKVKVWSRPWLEQQNNPDAWILQQAQRCDE